MSMLRELSTVHAFKNSNKLFSSFLNCFMFLETGAQKSKLYFSDSFVLCFLDCALITAISFRLKHKIRDWEFITTKLLAYYFRVLSKHISF